MRFLRNALILLLAFGAAACDHGILDVRPVDEIDIDVAIVDEASAQAALIGAYATITSTWYYGGEYLMFSEIQTDNATHTGTFASYADADLNDITADNGSLSGMWNTIYIGINRVNILIENVPNLEGVSQSEIDRIVGEAYALRALHYHNLVRAWGGVDVNGTFQGVPLVLASPASVEEAAEVARSDGAAVYSQILADLQEAETRLQGFPNGNRTRVTPGFIQALTARVHLYAENWPQAAAAAEAVRGSGDYMLVPVFGDLFQPTGGPTEEDIFRGAFTATDFNDLGWYYQFAGRFELGATQDIYNAFDQALDQRWAWTFGGTRPDGTEVTKFPTTIGAERIHVIRYAEVLLILAEALARQDELSDAVDRLNEVRERAGLAGYVLGVDLPNDQDAVIDAILDERRLELAFEGDRWFDLVRTDRAVDALAPFLAPHEKLWPVPQRELDVAPNLTQNPGY
jgi:starch-binding outer membrane protein, SusD/RagB family